MSITLEKPQIISLLYKPEPNDPNRGACEWARFYLDLKNYTLSIESDCGNYSYGWYPTPNSESFLHLCTRFDKDYLLCKISDETVVDGDETFKLMKELIKETNEANELEIDTEDWSNFKYEIESIERICKSYQDPHSIYDAINEILRYSDMDDLYEPYDIQERIVMTYPNNAKKIAEIFVSYIEPYIKANLLQEEH